MLTQGQKVMPKRNKAEKKILIFFMLAFRESEIKSSILSTWLENALPRISQNALTAPLKENQYWAHPTNFHSADKNVLKYFDLKFDDHKR